MVMRATYAGEKDDGEFYPKSGIGCISQGADGNGYLIWSRECRQVIVPGGV
jgi:hypothetical protein